MYAASKFLWALGRPSAFLLLLALAGVLLVARRRDSKAGVRLLTLFALGVLVCASAPVGTWLLRPLEDRFPPMIHAPAQVDGIILLGGAVNVDLSIDRGMPALNLRAGRVTDFVALARRFPNARLVFTGGNAEVLYRHGTEAGVMRGLLGGLGISPSRVVFEAASRNTHENALYSMKLVRPARWQRWLLVTSAADMPRAIGCFRAVGWPVMAVPVDYHTRQHGWGWSADMSAGLAAVDWASHEWVGLVYYRLRGWTPELFPGP
jgi:uncharacterized SAM-binding protein YcdF (DUF218 family)